MRYLMSPERSSRRRPLSVSILLIVFLLACQLGPVPTPTQVQVAATVPFTATATLHPTVTAKPDLVPSHTPIPSHTPTSGPPTPGLPTPSPTPPDESYPPDKPYPPLPTAGPLPAVWTAVDFAKRNPVFAKNRASAGLYYPSSLAFDASSGTAYVLGYCELEPVYQESGPEACLAAMDTETGQLTRQTVVPGSSSSQMLVEGDALYLSQPWSGALAILDRETLAVRQTISDVFQVAADGQGNLYAATMDALMRLEPEQRTVEFDPQTVTFSDSPIDLAATPERIYLLGYETLRIFSTDLKLVNRVDLKALVPPDGLFPRTLALDRQRRRLYIGCTRGLWVLDTQTDQLTQAPAGVQSIERLALDATGETLYAQAYFPPSDWFGGTAILSIQTANWQTRTLSTMPGGQIRDLAVDEKAHRLYLLDSDDHALIPLDLAAGEGQIGPRLPLGIVVEEAIVDEAGGRLYVSESSGWIHVLDRRTYDELGRLYGGRHIGLDVAHHRLYAGDLCMPVVTAFDTRTLQALYTIAQPGKPRANPATDEVVIVNRRFYVFDGQTGRPHRELQPGIGVPPQECLGCYYTIATEVIIDGQRGLTATLTYTPWPGKPGPQESITYDPLSGRAYYALLTGGYVYFSSLEIYPDMRALQNRGAQGGIVGTGSAGHEQPILKLEGLSGYLALDSPARRLYVVRGRFIFVLDSETLQRIGLVDAVDWTPVIAAVDGDLGRLYTPHGSQLVVWTRAGGAPPPPLPPVPATLTNTVTAILPSPDFAHDQTLLATIDGWLCRSTDGGQTWQRLRGSLPDLGNYPPTISAVFSPDYANDRTLFAGIFWGDSHGEGVWRSTDGGQTWQPMNDGLYDLRVYRVVASPRFAPDRSLLAYVRTRPNEALYRSTDGGENWQLVTRQTGFNKPPLPRPEELLAFEPYPPDEPYPQFQCDYQGVCQRSDDGGGTWVPFDTGAIKLDGLVGSAPSPHLGSDHTIYFLTQSNLYRYNQVTRAWERCTSPIFKNRQDYTRYLACLAIAATGPATHDLFIGSYAGEFYRLPATDLAWQPVRPEATPIPRPTSNTTREPPTPEPCTSPIDERFQVSYAGLPQKLGCSVEAGTSTLVAFQPFQQGMMFWRQDTREVYVLQQDATWRAYPDTWDESQAVLDPNLQPPEGLYQPVRGFGKVWREQLGGPQAQVGWATQPEHGFNTTIQVFNYGLLMQGENDQLYVLYYDGTWQAIEVKGQGE